MYKERIAESENDSDGNLDSVTTYVYINITD